MRNDDRSPQSTMSVLPELLVSLKEGKDIGDLEVPMIDVEVPSKAELTSTLGSPRRAVSSGKPGNPKEDIESSTV